MYECNCRTVLIVRPAPRHVVHLTWNRIRTMNSSPKGILLPQHDYNITTFTGPVPGTGKVYSVKRKRNWLNERWYMSTASRSKRPSLPPRRPDLAGAWWPLYCIQCRGFKNRWRCTSTSFYSFMRCRLMKHKNNFIILSATNVANSS
jgi:hypothetical protein